MNCLFIFIMQMTLTFSSLFNILDEEKENDKKDPKEIEKNELEKISFWILVTRYFSAVILHLTIEGEVGQAINMMKFTLYRTGSWNIRVFMFLVATMQLLGALCTETVNMISICVLSKNKDIIQNLLAFSIIA